MPAVGIDDNFFELGGDSLSAIKVVSMLRLRINLVDFYTHPTVRALAEKMINENNETGILVRLTRRKKASGRNVVCFPYGGGSALAYRKLSNAVQEKDYSLNIYSLNLPGHDYGAQNELMPIKQTAEMLAAEIAENLSGELILYSHCVGCALMLATVDLLEKACVPVKAVFIGGVMLPRFIRLYGRFINPWMFYTDKRIIRYLKKIGLPKDLADDKEYAEVMISAFRHDSGGFTSYIYSLLGSEAKKREMPTFIVVGGKDITTKKYSKRYLRWHKFFENIKLIAIENADHYFIDTHADNIAEYIDSI